MLLEPNDLAKLKTVTDMMKKEFEAYRKSRASTFSGIDIYDRICLVPFGVGLVLFLANMPAIARNCIKSNNKVAVADVAIAAIAALYEKAVCDKDPSSFLFSSKARYGERRSHAEKEGYTFQIDLKAMFANPLNTLEECVRWLRTILDIINDEDNRIEERSGPNQLNLDGSSGHAPESWHVIQPGLHPVLDTCFNLIKPYFPIKEAMQGKSWAVQQSQNLSALFEVGHFDITYNNVETEYIYVNDFAANTEPAVAPRGTSAMFQPITILNPVYGLPDIPSPSI